MNDTTRQLGGALGVAVLGTVMNDAYLGEITVMKDIPILSLLPEEAMRAVESSIQGASMIAQNAPNALIGQVISDGANQAFVTGMSEAMLIGSIIIAIASVITLLILPSTIRPAAEDVPQMDSEPAAAEHGIPVPVGD